MQCVPTIACYGVLGPQLSPHCAMALINTCTPVTLDTPHHITATPHPMPCTTHPSHSSPYHSYHSSPLTLLALPTLLTLPPPPVILQA